MKSEKINNISNIDGLRQGVIDEFSSEVTQKKYIENAKKGLWQSEEILIDKYLKKNSIILDLGCGTGRTTIPLYRKGYKVIGIDLTPKMIESAKKIADGNNLNIEYRTGDATKLDFADNFFDNAIFSNNGASQIPGKQNRQKALNEVFRVLKPGGCFIFTAHKRYYSPYYLFFWAKQWFKLYILKALGFSVKEIDFGDRFFPRTSSDAKFKQEQYIHIPSVSEVKKQIKNSGFELIETVAMAELSESDAANRRSTLTKKDNADKSPVFYVCKK